jgi:hypothetical protein
MLLAKLFFRAKELVGQVVFIGKLGRIDPIL